MGANKASKAREIEKKVLSIIKPTPKEYRIVWNAYNRIKDVVENTLREHDVEAEVTLQGSIVKDTWISGERDLDIFVLFPETWNRRELEEKGYPILLEAAKRIGRYSTRYAEHPYVRVYVDGVEADLVPAIRVSDPSNIKSAVDRTPFHTKYVIENLPPKKRDDVRLLKKFMKTIGVYGAEVRVKGFSGYLVELLVITYNGFHNVLREASRWRPPVYINTLGLPRNEFLKYIRLLKKRYPDSVVYAPDPVDPKRNVAAAVSMRSLAVFSIASKCYLLNPSMDFFIVDKSEYSLDYVKSTAKGRCIFFLVSSSIKPLPPESIWGELERIADRLSKVLRNFGFKTIYYDIWSNDIDLGVIGIEVEDCFLKNIRYHRGPPFYSGERALNFISKHYSLSYAGPWVSRDGFLETLISRRYTNVYDVIVDRLWEFYVAPDFRDKYPILTSVEGIYSIAKLYEGLWEWVVDFVLRKPVWMRNCIL